MSDKIVRFHAPGCDYPDLANVPGIESYGARATLGRGGVVVVSDHPDIPVAVSDYRQIGLGPNEIIPVRVNGGGLYRGMLSDPVALARLRFFLQADHRLEVFRPGPTALEFARRAGIDWTRQMASPHPDVAEPWNNKRVIRQQALQNGLSELFPRHILCRTEAEIRSATRALGGGKADGVVIKLTDRASSDGMIFLGRGESPDTFISQYSSFIAQGVVVEEAWNHQPWSVVYRITDAGPEFQQFSLQIMEGVAPGAWVSLSQMRKGIAHWGNVVATPGINLGLITPKLVQATCVRLKPFLRLVHASGYRGVIGVDLMLTEDKKVFVLECNARPSHSGFVGAVVSGVSQHWRGAPVVVAGGNVVLPARTNTYTRVKECLGSLLLTSSTPTTGCVVYHPTLPQQAGKVGIMAVGPTYDESLRVFREAERVLS